MKRPESKKDVMKKLGGSIYYSKYFPNVHVILAPLHDLHQDDVPLHWNKEHECVSVKIKQTLTHTCDIILPNTKNPFITTVDASTIGVGTILVQADDKDQMQDKWYNSRIFTENEQEMLSLML